MEEKANKKHSAPESRVARRRIWLQPAPPLAPVFTNRRFLATLLVLLFFSNWLGHRWLFERATLAGTDVLLSVTEPRTATHCKLVTIDEREFNRYLGEWLQPEKLTTVLRTILAYEPKVLIVDIDTAAPRFSKLEIPSTKSKIVWARVSHQEVSNTPGQRKRGFTWKAGEVLGNRAEQPEYLGSPLFPQDPDWVVRGFQRVVTIDANVQSLHWQALRAYCDAGAPDACLVVQQAKAAESANDATEAAEALRVRQYHFDWDFPVIPISDLLGPEGSAKPRAGGLGDVVLLGAKFGDIHPTSFGPKLGIELTASAVETELQRDSRPWPVEGWMRWALKFLLAFAIVWLNYRLMPLWAAAGTLILLVVVFTSSFLGVYYGLFRMEFLPFMIGIWIEQLVEASERAQHQAEAATLSR
jgi:CHASE2 domain-containing sensor protein